MWFSEELFVEHKSSSMRHFLENAIHLQSFKQVSIVPRVLYCPLLGTAVTAGQELVGQRQLMKCSFKMFLTSFDADLYSNGSYYLDWKSFWYYSTIHE